MSYFSFWKRQIESDNMTTLDQKREFKDRVYHWAGNLEVDVVWLGIRSMRNKWASCSANGHLNFNEDLLGLDQDIWDYVIVHELLHFFVPNHGKLWKSLMRVHLGNYEKTEARLAERASVRELAEL